MSSLGRCPWKRWEAQLLDQVVTAPQGRHGGRRASGRDRVGQSLVRARLQLGSYVRAVEAGACAVCAGVGAALTTETFDGERHRSRLYGYRAVSPLRAVVDRVPRTALRGVGTARGVSRMQLRRSYSLRYAYTKKKPRRSGAFYCTGVRLVWSQAADLRRRARPRPASPRPSRASVPGSGTETWPGTSTRPAPRTGLSMNVPRKLSPLR